MSSNHYNSVLRNGLTRRSRAKLRDAGLDTAQPEDDVLGIVTLPLPLPTTKRRPGGHQNDAA